MGMYMFVGVRIVVSLNEGVELVCMCVCIYEPYIHIYKLTHAHIHMNVYFNVHIRIHEKRAELECI